MPVFLQSFMTPAFPQLPFLMEDKYLRGGFQSLNTLEDRDTMHVIKKKPGMLVYIKETSSYYQLSDDLQVWQDAALGGGIGEVVAPLVVNGDGALEIDANRILPNSGEPGQIPQKQLDGSIVWVDNTSGAGNRGVVEQESPVQLATGETHEFEMTMAKTVMLLKVTLNAPDIQIEGFTNGSRDDQNPFTFISHVDFITDEGVFVIDSSNKEFKRRFSFMANLEDPANDKLYFRFTNKGVTPVIPRVTIEYLSMQ